VVAGRGNGYVERSLPLAGKEEPEGEQGGDVLEAVVLAGHGPTIADPGAGDNADGRSGDRSTV
jgi:hypothetical protein